MGRAGEQQPDKAGRVDHRVGAGLLRDRFIVLRRITTLIGTFGASRRAVSTIRIEVSSRPAATITALARATCAASSVALPGGVTLQDRHAPRLGALPATRADRR